MPGRFVADYFEALAKLLRRSDGEAVARLGGLLWAAYEADRQVFLLGNGGSAATASHFACDLGKGTAVPGQRRFRALSLADNVAMLTALGNDIGYEKVFTEQLAALMRPGDLVVAISASGNSPNVVDAVEYANQAGGVTVALVGFGGGRLKEIAQQTVHFASDNYGLVEDAHLILEHALTQWLRRRLAGEG